jgi:capsule polysaccharide modification protein KpsS
MQNTGETVWYRKDFSVLANDIIRWSRENKKHVIFKWHNGCIDHSNPERWFGELQEKSDYSSIEYKLPLSVLIKNCEMMWTASSMSGIEALINNKPVSIFGETEYMEMTKVCNTPDEAYNTIIPKDLEQWLTYYVRKYCINIYAKDAEQKVTSRLINHFEKNFPLDELILS